MLRGRDLVLSLRNPKTFTCIFRFRIITTAAGSAKKEGSGYPLSQLSPELSLFFCGICFFIIFLFFSSFLVLIGSDSSFISSLMLMLLDPVPACKENLDGEKVICLFPSWL